ncbi:GDP-mannose 4,6-dehydratase [Candidatus Sumerlaeota bacterium]|nr:GDP-mannose 4,6-dehydratase [Candidatus Sumerlaeota bacterium]
MTKADQPLQNRLCVVTGAGGFIGSHLVEALLDRGARVRALVHYNALGAIGNLAFLPSERLDSKRLEIVWGDVCDARCVRDLVRGASRVFHLAALIGIPYSYVAPESYVQVNVRGTLNVLEACRDAGVERLLHTSTSETYGSARAPSIDERHPLQAQSPYAASKIAADKLAESYILSFDLPATTVRPFNTFGPRQSMRAVIPTVMVQAMSDRCEEIRVGALDPIRDLTYVEDTARGFCEIALAPLEKVRGRLYNLGTGVGVSVAKLIHKIQKVLGTDKPVVVEENRVRPALSEVRQLVSNAARVKEEVGWTASTSLEDGLLHTAEWLREHPLDERAENRYRI